MAADLGQGFHDYREIVMYFFPPEKAKPV